MALDTRRIDISLRRAVVCNVCLLLAFAGVSSAQTSAPAKQVLLLSSPDHDPFTYHTRILRSELNERSPWTINFLQASSHPPAPLVTTSHGDPVADYLSATLAGRKLDLVVTIGGPAAVFAHRNREQLFHDTPILYTALESRFLTGRALTERETAVTGTLDMPQIIDNMLLLLPETRSVFVVIGASELEQFWRSELTREFQRFKDRVTFVWTNELSLAEIFQRASSLPAHSAIFFPVLSMDGKGVLQSQDHALEQLHKTANAPIFGIYDFQVGRGAVGGPMMSMTEVARHSADVAIRILRGESPGSIHTPLQVHSQPTYDAAELEKWDIREARLPTGSTVLFRKPGIWEQYKSYLLGATMIIAVQSALIAGLAVQRVRRRRTERALRESEQRFRTTAARNQDLAGRLIDAQEAERSRIARELHDDLSQQLAGLAIMLSNLKRKFVGPDARPDVDHAVATLQDRASNLAESVRNLSHQLHPSVLQHAGLAAALRRHCADVEQQHHLTVTFSADPNVDLLGQAASICLFRVTQEALANAVRHARAGTIRVELTSTAESVELRVVDDGVGFVASERTAHGLGLRSIDERVRLAHGTLTLDSQPGQGTTLLVRIPAPSSHREAIASAS